MIYGQLAKWVGWVIIANISRISLRKIYYFIIATRAASLAEPSWPFPTSQVVFFPWSFEMSHVFLPKVPQRKSRKSGGSSHPSLPFPFEWDVQICFSLEQLLHIWHVLGGDVPASQGTHSGQGLAPDYGLPHQNQGSRDPGLQVTSQQQPNLTPIVCAGEQWWIQTHFNWVFVTMLKCKRPREIWSFPCLLYKPFQKIKSICLHSPLYWEPRTVQFSLDIITLISFWKITSSPLALGIRTIFPDALFYPSLRLGIFCHSFIGSFHKYSQRIYFVSSTSLGVKNIDN